MVLKYVVRDGVHVIVSCLWRSRPSRGRDEEAKHDAFQLAHVFRTDFLLLGLALGDNAEALPYCSSDAFMSDNGRTRGYHRCGHREPPPALQINTTVLPSSDAPERH